MTVRKAWVRRSMVTAAILAATLGPGLAPVPAFAQGGHPVVGSMIPEAAAETMYAKIQAINPQTREVTLAAASGRVVTVVAGSQIPLETLKAGEKVDVQYYRSVAFMVSKGMQAPKGQAAQLPPEQAQLLAQHAQAQAPGGISVPMTHVSGLVVGIRPEAHMVDVVNPTGGGVYAIQVSDPSRAAMLGSLKVGDTVTAVVSPPIATSIKPDRGFFSNLFGG